MFSIFLHKKHIFKTLMWTSWSLPQWRQNEPKVVLKPEYQWSHWLNVQEFTNHRNFIVLFTVFGRGQASSRTDESTVHTVFNNLPDISECCVCSHVTIHSMCPFLFRQCPSANGMPVNSWRATCSLTASLAQANFSRATFPVLLLYAMWQEQGGLGCVQIQAADSSTHIFTLLLGVKSVHMLEWKEVCREEIKEVGKVLWESYKHHRW